MAKLWTCSRASLAQFEAKLSEKTKLKGKGKFLRALKRVWGLSLPKSLGLLLANIICSN